MITKVEDLNTRVKVKGGKFTSCHHATFYGNAADDKADCEELGVKNADLFYEMDTKNVYLYSEDGEPGKKWIPQ